MPLLFAAIAPHGFPIIPELSDDANGALETRQAMQELGRRAGSHQLDAIVIAGPHGVRVEGAICLADVSRAAGTLRWGGRQVELNVPVDGELTDSIAEEARNAGIPVALAGYAGNRRFQSIMPMDWGVLTPLWFLGHDRNMVGHGDVLSPKPSEDVGPPAVIITPSRSLDRQTMVNFGHAVGRAMARDERNVAFIASCDWGHTHKEDGPYGFHEDAARVDSKVVEAVRSGDLVSLMALTDVEVQNAAIDGLWQTLMLAGVLAETPLVCEVLCYEAPSYYGMLVATYE
ncbi:MAG: aromatic ring-opening dioxygenase subunit LigB [Thermomicrobiales bacterium]